MAYRTLFGRCRVLNKTAMMAKIAALPMYDFPELRRETDRLWQAISTEMRKLGLDAPEDLSQPDDVWTLWRNPDMIFAQTCGLPYVEHLRNEVTLIGTPDYGVIEGKPGWYTSVVIKRKGDARKDLAEFRSATFTYSSKTSQSGCFAMMYSVLCKIGEGRFFGNCIASGSHAVSVEALVDGRADIASIDAVTWQHLQNFLPAAASVEEFMTTPPTPGLPFITSNSHDGAALANAVGHAIQSLSDSDRKALGLLGFWHAQDEDYQIIADRADECAGILSVHGLS